MTLIEDRPPLSEPMPNEPRPGLLARLGQGAARRPRRVLAIWALVVLVAAPLAITLTSVLSGAGREAQGSDARKVRDELRADCPQLGDEAAIVDYTTTTIYA